MEFRGISHTDFEFEFHGPDASKSAEKLALYAKSEAETEFCCKVVGTWKFWYPL